MKNMTPKELIKELQRLPKGTQELAMVQMSRRGTSKVKNVKCNHAGIVILEG